MFSSPAIYRFTDDALEERAALLQSASGVSRVEADTTILREFPNACRQRVFRVAINKHFVDKTGDYELLNSKFRNCELTLDELLRNVKAGSAVCPAILKADSNGHTRRTNENWLGSEIVMIDVDHGMLLEDFQQHELSMYACARYTTYGHTNEHHRFRILYALPGVVTDPIVYRRIVSWLIKQLGADEARKDPCGAFFGNQNADVFINPNNVAGELAGESIVLPIELLNQLISPDPISVSSLAPDFNETNRVYTATELLNVKDDDKYLWHPFLRSHAVVGMVGLPDSTKSILSRNIALAIVTGQDELLGLPLKPVHRRVLIVASEDSPIEIGRMLKRPFEALSVDKESADRLQFLFMADQTSDELFKLTEDHLRNNPVDLLILDGFGDIHVGEQNSNSDVRATLKIINAFATRYKCSILVVHHLTKGGYGQTPAHVHVAGASSFVQKVRAVLELRNGEDNTKFLSVIKGNYISQTLKSSAMILKFDEETFLHFDTGERIAIEDIPTKNQATSKSVIIDWVRCFNPPSGRFTTKVVLSWLRDTYGLGRTQSYQRINEAITSGLIRKESLGRESCYLATELLVGSDARPPP